MEFLKRNWSYILFGLCIITFERAQYKYIKSQIDQKIDSGEEIEPLSANGGINDGLRK